MSTPAPESAKPELLIVDDDPAITDTLAYVLGSDFEVIAADSRAHARALLRQRDHPPRLALVDLGLPPRPHRPDEGFELIAELVAMSPAMKILVLSGQSDESDARHARTLGAIDFVAKPAEPAQLLRLLRQALEVTSAESGVDTSGLIGKSPPMLKLREQLAQFANAPFPVLIEGESGTGKELVAQALHKQSKRAGKPFLALNCAAISPTLVEPTLFGYAKGAFTGATAARAGYFEEAVDSTLFLDEIGELPLDLQAKLLRVLENGEYQRVGETQSRVSNARIVTATNRDLRSEVRHSRFRADLYHRLSVFTVEVPALRDLGEDKLLLLDHFREFYARQIDAQAAELDPEALRLWLQYPFPGNVRELRNIVIRLCTKHAGIRITPALLQAEFDRVVAPPLGSDSMTDQKVLLEAAQRQIEADPDFRLDEVLRRWELGFIEAALAMTNGNLSQAAKRLGINRTTLYGRMQNRDEDEGTR
ncbi:MAG: sigma-54-dependent transcriptional regulator [Betaproteobacteria bacterium]